MTTLNVELSTTLQATLGQPGVWAYAVFFDSAGTANWTELVLNGTIQNSGTNAIDLPEPYSGGKVYLLVQSQDPGNHEYVLYDSQTPKQSLITQQSDINWDNADTWNTRFDSIEVTLANSANDAGNLTSVNGFGLPMEMSVTYSDATTSTRGYKVSADSLFDQFSTIGDSDGVDTYDTGPLSGKNRMAFSPAEAISQAPADPPFQASDWDDYIATLKVADPGVVITGFFNGAPDANKVWHNGGFYSYSLEWDATKEVFWLSPATNSQIKGYIEIKPAQLANSIYSTLGDVAIYTNKSDTDPYRIFDSSTFATGEFSMNTGENNQWGSVLAEFLTGFTAGFYGTTGKSFNPLSSDTVNLNENWNWDPDYAFGENLSGSLPANHFQDAYSKVFYPNSNSYGSGYTDNLMRVYDEGGPLMPLSNPAGAPSAGINVDAIDLTIFDDSETPRGYEQTVLHHYLAPDGGSYQVPDSTNAGNFKLSFSNVGVVLADDTVIKFDIFTGLVGGVPQWETLTLDPGSGSPSRIWTLVHNDSGPPWSISVGGADQGTGNLLITGFPTADTDGTYWNRIHVGDKIFNLYTELTDGGTKFANPDVSGQAGDIAVDGLAVIQPPDIDPAPDSVITFTVAFLTSSGVTVDPDHLTFDPTTIAEANRETPDAPVAGTLSGSSFTALAGQTNQGSNTIQTSEAKVAFGWTGHNPNSDDGDDPWIKAYTNKTSGLNYAEVTIEQSGSGHAPIAPLNARADVDGQWLTDGVALGNGTYTVTMQEHLAGTSGPSSTAVNNASKSLTMTVDIDELVIDVIPNGRGLELVAPGDGGLSGNWLNLEATASTASAGTTLLLYAVNADGEMVDRSSGDAGDSVTIDDATLGTIGVLHDDDGGTFLYGSQTVFLRDGLELKFATLTGKDTVTADLNVTSVDPETVYDVPDAVSVWLDASLERPGADMALNALFDRPAAYFLQHGGAELEQLLERPAVAGADDARILEGFKLAGNHDLDLTLEVGDFTLLVESDNNLSVDAQHSHGQRLSNDAMVYLKQGSTLEVELAGNSDNVNELGFVRLDIDPETGDRSVNGVAYGDTAAFRTAVEDNLDDAFTFTRGGDFRESTTWTVAGQDGFYAPVLVAQSGDVFVIGDANPGGAEHVRMFGHHTWGFEEVTEAQGADFDYNDMTLTLSLPTGSLSDDWLV